MWEVNAKIRNEREMGRAVEKEKRMCQNAHFGFTLIVSLIEESKRLRGKERKRQRDKETKRKRGKDKNRSMVAR